MILLISFLRVIAGYFIEEPLSDIQLIEGQILKLKYKLVVNSPSSFLKNDEYLPETKNIIANKHGRWRMLIITNVTPNNNGSYCLNVEGHRSRLTNLTVQRMLYIFIVFTQVVSQTHAHSYTSIFKCELITKWASFIVVGVNNIISIISINAIVVVCLWKMSNLHSEFSYNYHFITFILWTNNYKNFCWSFK